MVGKLGVGRIRIVVVAGLAILLALVVAVANAAFSSPVTLSPPGQSAFFPQVASDADGDAVAVWTRSDGGSVRAEARLISAAGALGPVKTLSPGLQNAFDPQIVSDADGDAVAVWERSDGANDRIEARSISAAGALGPVKTLSNAGQNASFPQIASDADGDAVAVWERSDGTNVRIQARSISAAGALGPVKTLSPAGQNASGSQIASDADGDAVAVWLRSDGSNERIEARSISAAGTLGPVKTLSNAGRSAVAPQIATDADGDAVAVWARFDGSAFRVQARSISAAGALGPVKTLSNAGQSAVAPQIASDADGDAVAVWERFDGSNVRIQARSISAAGALGPVATLSNAGQAALEPQIASDADGDAVAVWARGDGSNFRIQARSISAAGALGPVETLSNAGQTAFDSQIASDADGDAVAVWRRSDGSNQRIQAAQGP